MAQARFTTQSRWLLVFLLPLATALAFSSSVHQVAWAQVQPLECTTDRIFEGTPENPKKTYSEATLPDPLPQGAEMTVQFFVTKGRLQPGEEVSIVTELDGHQEGRPPTVTLLVRGRPAQVSRSWEITLPSDFREGTVQIFGRVKSDKGWSQKLSDTALPLLVETAKPVRAFKLYLCQVVNGQDKWEYGELEKSSTHPSAEPGLPAIPAGKTQKVENKLLRLNQEYEAALAGGDIVEAERVAEEYTALIDLGETDNTGALMLILLIGAAAAGGWGLFYREKKRKRPSPDG